MRLQNVCAVAIVALLTCAFSEAAFASVINVDFNVGSSPTYSGLGAYTGDTGTFWNGYASSTGGLSENLKASDGITTTSVKIDVNFGANDNQCSANPALVAPALMSDYYYLGRGTPGTFAISGLIPGEKYQVYLYSQNGGHASAMDSIFTIGTATATAAGGATGASFEANKNYVVFSDVVAAADGTISGSGQGPNGGWNCLFCGVQVVGAVPEPGTAVLLTAGLLGLLAYAWRKRK